MAKSGTCSWREWEESLDISGISGAQSSNIDLSAGKNEQLKKSAKAEFLAYMEKSPAERMRDAWLKSHGLTEEDLKAMDAAAREAVEKQLAEDIKRQMQEEAKDKALKASTSPLSISALLATTL